MEYFEIEKFDQMTSEIYAPAYSLIAQQIVTKTGITSGKCLDIGTGCGYLGIALAQITSMDICLFDISPKSLQFATQQIAHEGLQMRMHTLQGDVHHIPLADNSINLAVSRGSIRFWENKAKSLSEIYRILAPGGFAYIGGGYGTDTLRMQTMKKKQEMNFNSEEFTKLYIGQHTPETLVKALEESNISSYEILTEGGLWAFICK